MKLTAADVSYRYPGGAWACTKCNISVSAGTSLALVGPNGAGKTTVGKLLAGIFDPTSGVVTLDGVRVSQMRARDRADRVCLCFQQPENELYHTSIRTELLERIRSRPEGDQRAYVERAQALLAALGYGGTLDVHPYDLDPWVRKTVTLSAALAGEREVTILDEPTVRLSWPQKKVLAAQCRDRQRAGGALVIVSHDLEFCEMACDSVRLVRDGTIGTPMPIGDIRDRAAQLGHNIWSSATYFVQIAAARLREGRRAPVT